MNTPRYWVIVPAAGVGSRLGGACPKQYLPLLGKPLMWHTLTSLAAVPQISALQVVIAPEDEWFDRYTWDIPKLNVLRQGGASRAQTVKNGLAALACAEQDWVLVHDAARCCISSDAVQRLMDTLVEDTVGGLLALPLADTLKHADSQQRIRQTLPRSDLWLAQTPQMFRAPLLQQALAQNHLELITDEASAIESLGLAPRLVMGEAQNLKVTYPDDLRLAQAILAARKAPPNV